MTEFLRKVADFFLLKASQVEELDAKIKATVTNKIRGAFFYGVAVGVIVTAIVVSQF